MIVTQSNGLTGDTVKDREWRQRSAERAAAKRRAAVEVTRNGQRTTLRRAPLKPVSDRRRVEAAVYRVRRVVFLEGKCCARCGVADRLTVHHMAGRVGDAYLDESRWLPLCVECHRHVTDHPREAVEQGYSLPRVGAA